MSDLKEPTVEPRMSIGDEFYSDGERWQVVRKPFLNESVEGEQWWYPSRIIHTRTIKESLVDDLTEEKS